MRKLSLAFAGFLYATTSFGCTDSGSDQEDESTEQGVDSIEQGLSASLDAKFNKYVQTVLDRDHKFFASIISSEVKQRIADEGTTTEKLHEKLRSMLLTTFPSIAETGDVQGRFSVLKVRREGDAIRLEFAFDGQPMSKPFYFVLENGDYKFNFLPPGFAKEAPEGAGYATRSYRVENLSPQGHYKGMTCSGAGGTTVWPNPVGGYEYITCSNKCGVFQGTDFWSGNADQKRRCDYNTWGPDVIIKTGSNEWGWYCVGGC